MSEVSEVTITELEERPPLGKVVNQNFGLELLGDVEVSLEVVLGRKKITVQQLMSLKQGEVLSFDQAVGEELSILLNGKEVAKGNLVAVEDAFGLRISSSAFIE